MAFTYKVLQEKYNELSNNLKELNKELTNYKYLYEKEKEEVIKLNKKVKEKDIIIDMFYKMYYKK